ncbi:MAG TPA: acetyl-CoA carboxylase carboxyltransferase subunit alpha [Chloroflexota bacterium]|nr:acetyl-CoA carboxylase carboxyltransferase subunit alpha [Chloroflexota bacterium]
MCPRNTRSPKTTPAWERVQLARHPQRPYTLDYLRLLCSDFVELHGDRLYGDDPALIGGLASFAGHTVMVIGHQKGRDTRENLRRRFGMARPEGYRKALRLMRHAERFGLPVISFIDTPGADPTLEAEERGQAWAIAQNLLEMARLQVPLIAVILGEGGSGGALAIGMGDRVLMLENAIYSVVSPEGCAAILWRDAARAPEAAEAMQITAPALLAHGIIDAIVPEPPGGAHTDPPAAAAALRAALLAHLTDLIARYGRPGGWDVAALLAARFARYRSIGRLLEDGGAP